MHTLVKPYLAALFFLFFQLHAVACVDSLWYKVGPVQCSGFRDGKIMVEQVFGGQAPYYYSIDAQSFSTNPVFDHLWAGHYIISVRDASGCITTVNVNLVDPEPLSVRVQANDSSIVAGKLLTLRALVYPETAVLKSIFWGPAHLFSKQDTLKQQIMISESTNFSVEVINTNGCISSNNLSIEVEPTNIYFPNAIRLGSNQDGYFTAYVGEGVQKISVLKIFSRSGATIFERRDFSPNAPLLGWNGRWDGQKVQNGVYLWQADIELLDGSLKHFDGTVTVID